MMQEKESKKHIIRPMLLGQISKLLHTQQLTFLTYPKMSFITSESIKSRPMSLARLLASFHSSKFSGFPPLAFTYA